MTPTALITTSQRNANGIPAYTRKEKKAEVEEPIKWTAKMKQSFEQAKNGEFVVGDRNNFWNL
jgi:hypothetical protein